MSFLYPAFLFGLLAVSVPIAIHLFNFRRTRKVYFTNVAFLRAVNTSTNSFRRLKQWLILAARIGFVAFLVLAFAQPFVRSAQAPGLSVQGATGIYVDNSLSMQNEAGNRQHLQLAAAEADALLGTLPKTPAVQLLTNDFESRDQQLATPDKLRDRLTEIGFSPTARPLETVYRRQASLLGRAAQGGPTRLVWFSDFQKSTAGDLPRLPLDTATRLFLVPLPAEQTANIYVDSVWLATPFVKEMEANTLQVRLMNTGREAVPNLPVKFFLDGRQVSSASVSLEPGSAQVASFRFTVQQRGLKRGRITFEDFPVTFDNEYFFVVNASPIIRIVHLHGAGAGGFVQDVFGNETIFQVRSLPGQNADPTLLATADMAVLDGVTDLGGSLPAALEALVKRGGSLLVFPPATPGNAHAPVLSRLGVPVPQAVPPAAPPGEPLSPPDTRNPFFASIFENTTQKDRLSMPTARAAWQWAGRGTPLLRFRNGQPFLSRMEVQRGRVYLCASPLDDAFTTFPKHALFVPVLYKMAALSKPQERLSFSFQEPSIAVEVGETGREPVFRLRSGALELIPTQRISGRQLVFDIPENPQTGGKQLAEAGYYDLVLDGKVQQVLAFNYDRKESQPACYTPAELKQLFARHKNVRVADALREGEFAREFKADNEGRPLWKYCLLAALAFLLAEILVIRLVKG